MLSIVLNKKKIGSVAVQFCSAYTWAATAHVGQWLWNSMEYSLVVTILVSCHSCIICEYLKFSYTNNMWNLHFPDLPFVSVAWEKKSSNYYHREPCLSGSNNHGVKLCPWLSQLHCIATATLPLYLLCHICIIQTKPFLQVGKAKPFTVPDFLALQFRIGDCKVKFDCEIKRN